MGLLANQLAAKGLKMRRQQTFQAKGRKIDRDVLEKDPDEKELLTFEDLCYWLNTKKFTGMTRVQVELWLLFEDQTSSIYAKITQWFLLFLIVFSTVLILLQSQVPCQRLTHSPSVPNASSPQSPLTARHHVSLRSHAHMYLVSPRASRSPR